MDCPGSEEIAAYADGRLEAPESGALLEHCAECDDCRRELAIVLQSHPPHAVPAPLKTRAVKALVRSAERERDRTPLRLRSLARGPKPGISWAAAAAILITIAGMIGFVMMLDGRGHDRPAVVKHPGPSTAERPAPRPEPPVEPRPPKTVEVPRRSDPVPPAATAEPKTREAVLPAPEATPETPVPPPPPKIDETRPEEPPARPAHTVVVRVLTDVQITDVTGAVSVKRKGARDRERLGSVARIGEGDVLTAEKTASFQIDGRLPVVLGDRTSVSLAFAELDQAPYLHIRSGEATVDSTGPTRWVVSDGRVAVVIKQARARFSAGPGDEKLRVAALTEPVIVQPDGGQVLAVRVGEELQVGKASAELRPLDPAAIAKKIAAFDAARPRQRTIFYTSCDAADANRGHFLVQEGAWFKGDKIEALLSKENKDRTLSVAIGPNPRFTWREGLVLRFRYMTNTRELQLTFRVEERRYSLVKAIPVDRKSMNQWISVEVPIHPSIGFRRDDGQPQLIYSTADKFDAIRFSARQQEVFGDQKPYILIDDIQVVETPKE